MYQTGMYVKEVLEDFSSGIWNAELKYDCSADRYTAQLRLTCGSQKACYVKEAAFQVKANCQEEKSLKAALQLLLVLTELEQALLAEHGDALIRDGMETNRESALRWNIRETMLRRESGETSAMP